MAHVRRGDMVVVIAGKEKGKKGKVLRVLTKKDRVVVERVMMVKRHTKPSQKVPAGGIIEKLTQVMDLSPRLITHSVLIAVIHRHH